MSTMVLERRQANPPAVITMRANVFRAPERFGLEEKPIPHAGYGEAVIKVRRTTICGTDIHIVKGEYPVKPGLTIGHECTGIIHELGPGVTGYHLGQRVLVGAITPCGQCESCLGGDLSQCGGPLGGWRFGNTIDGVQAEYVLVPHAQANLALIPDGVDDEQVLLLTDIASTGFSAAESGHIRLGDTVAVFAQGPIGLCATLGARLMGASQIIAIDPDPHRLHIARTFGATSVMLPGPHVIREVKELTGGRGVDLAIEALGTQETFEGAVRVTRAGGTVSSLGVYSGHLKIPLDAFGAGLSDLKIVTTLCPGGKERMARLMRMVETARIDLTPLITHRFPFERIAEAYALFRERREGVLKVVITMPA